MKKMEIRQTKMSGRVRRANCGRSANSSERLGDLLVRRRPGVRLMTPYNLPLNNCLICLKPLDPVSHTKPSGFLMRGPYQIWAGAFFFTSSRLVSTLATSSGKSKLFPCKGQRDGPPGGFKNVCHVRQEVAQRGGLYGDISGEDVKIHWFSGNVDSQRARTGAGGISGVN
jgi:hypothetical protein